MDLFVNDLSIHEQFHTMCAFRQAFGRLMGLRAVAQRYGREAHCHRMFVDARPAPGMTMQQALQGIGRNELRAAMSWMTHGGPFWDDSRRHGDNDWLECRGEIVTDTAVGEAAFRALHGAACGLLSVTPSDWDYTPLDVVWRQDENDPGDRTAALENWWDEASLGTSLRDAPQPIRSWVDLSVAAAARFKRLTFASDCFDPLGGIPFSDSATERFLVLFDILESLVQAFDKDGKRTPEGHKLHQNHFRGRHALFSDSSTTEKNDFRDELTFPHPNNPVEHLFCTWHGKIRHMTLRLHYSWSGRAGEPVLVVYAGPKITKR